MNGPLLAIETAIGGGSIAVLSSAAGTRTILSRLNVARADKLLVEISGVLDESRLTPTDLGLIAVSLGPGSFTGMRIGIATATGLAAALRIKCIGITATDAMLERSLIKAETICAVPIARDLVCAHTFDSDQSEVCQPTVVSRDEFKKEVERGVQVIAHRQLVQEMGSAVDNLIDAGEDIAALVGERAVRTGTTTLSPVFARSHK